MNQPLNPLGTPPNAWHVNADTADITRPPVPPQPITLTTETKTLRLDLAKSALLVIDMQNDFFDILPTLHFVKGWGFPIYSSSIK